ncbi:NUDIX hydrolase, partial [Vibrio splendidus]
MNRDNFLQQFQLNPTVGYHPESVGRVSHISGEQLRKAAVVVGLVEREDGLHVIFTKRAAHLKHHPGQVSFPGGKHELSDPSMQFTALRELHEEVGIRSDQVKIVGQLPALSTISKFS